VSVPVNRHRIWQLAWTLRSLRPRGGSRSSSGSTTECPVFYQTLFERTILIVVAIKLVVFVVFGFYNRWWRYVSTRDMWGARAGVIVACLIADVTVPRLARSRPAPPALGRRARPAADPRVRGGFAPAGSNAHRAALRPDRRPRQGGRRGRCRRTGRLIIRELQRNRALGYTPIG
jgi:hypothetical protein